MMPWKSPKPVDHWSTRERVLFEGELWDRLKFFTFAWTPGTIAASTIATFTIAASGVADLITPSVTGMRVGMPVKVTSPASPAPGLVWDAAVTASDTVTVWVQNLSAVDQAAPSGSWSIVGVIT